MRQSERIARAFHEAYEHMAPLFGYETRSDSALPWEQVPAKNRALMVATVAYLLEEHVIEAPRRLPRRREFAGPGAVRGDLEEIGRTKDGKLVGLLSGLAELYARAHEDVLAGGGSGELGAGRGSLHGVDPTQDQTLDGFEIEQTGPRSAHLKIQGGRAWRRHQVRMVGDAIRDVRNRLYTARETLESLAPPKGFRQPEKLADDNIGLDPDEYADSIAKQEQRAASGEV